MRAGRPPGWPVFVEDANGALTVAAVESRSAATVAGIAAGDVIVSVDGLTVDAAGLKPAIAGKKPGDTLHLLVRRGAAERTIDAVLAARLERTWRMTPVPNPSPGQAAILESWTAITVTR